MRPRATASPGLRHLVAAVLMLVAWGTWADEPGPDGRDYGRDLPRIPAVSADEALATMDVADGFTLELVASEPLLASPVAMDWDEDGRLFVAEMRGYSEDRDDQLGRVRLLFDDDRDGRYDRAVIFAEGLAWPTAICCWDGGVFVGDAPDVLFFRDTDGDGVADERKRVLTGFGTSNVQGLFNSFRYGLDNRIHASASSAGGEVRRVVDGEPGGEPIQLRGRDFSFDPRSLTLRPETGGAQHGMSCDDSGQRYVCANSDHAIRCMLEDRLLGRNPDYPAPAGRESIAVDGPQAAVFRASPVEPWRVLRTRLRASGIVPGIVEGGGRPAGYFTSATGITVVRGDRVGELRGMLVVGDVGSNLVHRKRLVPHGSGVRAERVDVERELIASRDIWFRPVQCANGPDGALWIIDMQREVIEHPASLPPEIKQHLDLTSGRDAGRLWRLTASDTPPARRQPLGDADLTTLVGLLSHPNGWQRDTAQRLLVSRGEAAAVPLLRAMLREAKPQEAVPRENGQRENGPHEATSAELGRLHALWTLAGLEAVTVDDVLHAVEDEAAVVRAAGIRLAEDFFGEEGPDAAARGGLLERLVALATEEPEIGVRLPLAGTAGFIADEASRRGILSALLARDGSDHWCRVAAASSMRNDAAAIATAWIDSPDTLATSEAAAVMPLLFAQIGRRGDPEQLTAAVAAIDRLAQPPVTGAPDRRPQATRLFLELEAAMVSAGRSLESPAARGIAQQLAAFNATVAQDAARPSAERVAAVPGMAVTGIGAVVDLLDDPEPAVVQAAVAVLDRSREAAAGEQLLSALVRVPEPLRGSVAAALARTAERALLLLAAIEDGKVSRGMVGQATLDAVERFPDDAVQQRAVAVLGATAAADRTPLVNAYRASLPSKPGDPQAGRLVFRRHCVSCHRVENAGHELGPSLAAMQSRGAEAMLVGILDPDREVLPAFTGRTAVRSDGRVVTGLLVAESAASLTLRAAEGIEHVIARDEIDELIDTGRSLMPKGFERSIEPDEMADLLAYLLSAH